jgi:electron transfer flavoprotein alpha subunit
MKGNCSEPEGKGAIMTGYLVFLEQREGMLRKASLDTWNMVQELADRSEPVVPVTGIIIGPAGTESGKAALSGSGTIFHATLDELALYQAERYTLIVSEVSRKEGISTIYFADTALSRDLAPRLSVRLEASLLSGCIGPSLDDAGSCSRPVYSGSALVSYTAVQEKRIYTLSLPEQHATCSREGSIVFVPLEDSPHEAFGPSALVQRIAMFAGKSDVAEAGIVVAGGRGMGSRESFVMLDELAGLLGGATGASRAVVDEGWRPHAAQIGQTGKSIAPRLYIACGISGSVQHLAGIGRAGTVVAINSDRHAPIFDAADFGIVGDAHIVVPALIDEMREFLKKK